MTFGTERDVQQLQALGAPQVLQLGPDRVRRWKINAEGAPEPIDTLSPDRLIDVFRDRRADWGPRTVLRLKGIQPDVGPRQLDFYDAGLIPAIDGVVFDKLDRSLRNALALARVVYSEHTDEAPDEGQLVRLVFRLLAAKIFSDRDQSSRLPGSAADALRVSESLYGQSDALAPVPANRETQETVWQKIRSMFNLQNISVEVLAYVYENTLVTPVHRRATGTHATPPDVAEYLVRRLPFESVPEDQRRVFEPFAGHAVFLIAAMGRLRELLDPAMMAEQRHSYFVRALAGMENDPFALEVGKLSLLLGDYPNRDSWNIQQGDVFTSPHSQRLIENASVILCNPPFEWFDRAMRSKYEHLKIPNPAVEVLTRVLASPPALLGFVLPWSFVDGQSYRGIRRKLIETYGRLEVVALPSTVFRYSEVEPVLLLASERGNTPTRFLCAEVKQQHYESFTRHWTPSWSTESIVDIDERSPVLWRHPLDRVWEELAYLPKLGDIALIHRGIEYKRHARLHVSDSPQPAFAAGLFNIWDGYQQFVVDGHVYLDLSPEVLLYQSHRNPWAEPKVIVNAARISRGSWRLAAVPDLNGLVCYQRFHGVWPKTNLPVEVVAAILNGYVANAYISTAKGSRDVKKERLVGIPVPDLTQSAVNQIVDLVANYRVDRSQWASSGHGDFMAKRCASLLAEIDAEVLRAYALPPSMEQEIVESFHDQQRRVPPAIQAQLSSSRMPKVESGVGSTTHTEDAGERLSGATSASETIRDIRTILGQRLTAIIAGVDDSVVDAWLRQEAEPSPDVAERLSATLNVLQLLIDLEAADTIQAWFVGKNRMLGDRAPAVVLKENPNAVLRAARAFAAYG